jgi:hypothetical protein
VVRVSEFASLVHFLAPYAEFQIDPHECPYVKARMDGTWPALSKLLPRKLLCVSRRKIDTFEIGLA